MILSQLTVSMDALLAWQGWASSSPSITSIVQWQPFSIAQCMRTSASSSSRVRIPAGIEVTKYRCSTVAHSPSGKYVVWQTLWLAKIAFHPELLTFSVEAGSLAGLHDSTPLGDHHRTLLGVPVAAGPHAREPRPPAATLHRAAEAPAADWAGGPGVLGRAAARVGAMVRCGRDREA